MIILMSLGAVLGLAVGLIHIGFALTDLSPRNVWDWYVVAMGLFGFVTFFPAMKWMVSQNF